jgi:hypothetical protein
VYSIFLGGVWTQAYFDAAFVDGAFELLDGGAFPSDLSIHRRDDAVLLQDLMGGIEPDMGALTASGSGRD